MQDSAEIALNFLSIDLKTFDVRFFRRPTDEMNPEDRRGFFQREQAVDVSGKRQRFAITFDPIPDFDEIIFTSKNDLDLTKRYLLDLLQKKLTTSGIETFDADRDKYHRVYIPLSVVEQGTETIWLEPYYLKSADRFGLLIDFKFWVSPKYKEKIGRNIDRHVLHLSGALDSRGNSNKAYYQFRFSKIQEFISRFFEKISRLQSSLNDFVVSKELVNLSSEVLARKTYQFADGAENNSPWFGLSKSGPYESPSKPCKFLFVFRNEDRSFAINLWNGLTGKSSPSTFPGLASVFRIPFSNDVITGRKVEEFTPQILTEIADDITDGAETILPIFITKSHETEQDDKLYYTIKHIFTKRNIPCQVVTKDLIVSKSSLKYSLSNIALQMFAKCGGKPWIVKPAIRNCLIIGIGSSNKLEWITDVEGTRRRQTEKFLTYSVLTDSSGLFREIEILSDANNEDDHYQQLKSKLREIMTKAIDDGTTEIVVHAPFKISRKRVWDELFAEISPEIKVSVLVINRDHKFFGYDLSKNSLIPYESSYISLSHFEFLVWFEGLQFQTSSLAKRIGAPVYINLWHSNSSSISQDSKYRNNLLQDCINLSGANWRGFKAKQLPVSVFYCQRIADFLKNFDQNDFDPIEIENLRPWFL